jgi:hypothetical protein
MAFPLRVSVTPDRLDASPGEALTVEVAVRNTSDIVEHYVIDLLGLPPGATARPEPEVTKLRPGESGAATVRLAIPQQPPAPAGHYPLGVLVRSRYREDVSRCEDLPLTVAPLHRIAVRVAPEVATGRGSARYTVEVANTGNTRVRLRLDATDPERRVGSSFQPGELDLVPGTAAQALLSVRAPVPWNREKQRALKVAATGVGVHGEMNVTFVQRPRFASKLARVAGMVGAVLVMGGAVVAAALILRPEEKPTVTPTPVASAGLNPTTGQPIPVPTTEGAPSAPAVPTTGAATPTGAGPNAVGTPRTVDLTRPGGQPGSGIIASDAFRDQGILLSGDPDRDGPPECLDATAVAIQRDAGGNSFLTAAKPNDPTACTFVPVQIRFVDPASSAKVVLGGSGNRRLEVSYRDLSQSIETDLEGTDDGRHGGIDFVVVRGLPADLTNVPPAAAVRGITFAPMQR